MRRPVLGSSHHQGGSWVAGPSQVGCGRPPGDQAAFLEPTNHSWGLSRWARPGCRPPSPEVPCTNRRLINIC